MKQFQTLVVQTTRYGFFLRSLVYMSFFLCHLSHLRLPPLHPHASTTIEDEDSEDNEDYIDPNITESDMLAQYDDVVLSYANCVRRQVIPYENACYILDFVDTQPRPILRSSLIAVKAPEKSLHDWKKMVRGILCGRGKTALYTDEAIRILEKVIPKKLRFIGTQHCESTLAVLAATGSISVSRKVSGHNAAKSMVLS